MNRRKFLGISTAALFSALLGPSLTPIERARATQALKHFAKTGNFDDGPTPLAEITAAVDVLVPADPEIPGDFKGSDYNADRIVAYMLGDLGQSAAVAFLNQFAKQTAGADFIDCSDEERLIAIQTWLRENDSQMRAFQDIVTGLLTFAVAGTYEANTPEQQVEVYTKMGWYDPMDPSSGFRVPNEGYADVSMLPISLKKGVRK